MRASRALLMMPDDAAWAPTFGLMADARIDTNTVVSSDLSAPAWQFTGGGTGAIASATPNGAGEVALNAELAEDVTLWRCHQWVAPTGTTAVTVTYRVRTGVAGDSGHQVQVALLDRTGGTVIVADTARTLTDTVTEYSFGQAVTAGTEYAVALYCANAVIGVGNRCRVESLTVGLTGATGVFAAGFTRIAVDAQSLDLCSQLVPPVYEEHIPAVRGTCTSRVRMLTTATTFSVEYKLDLASSRETYGDIGLHEGGRPVAHLATTSTAQAYIGRLDSPGSGQRYVDIVNGYQQETGSGDIRASMARAIYLDDAAVEVHNTRPDLVIYGASVICGRNAESPCNESVPVQLRTETLSTACIGWGASALKDSCADAAARASWAVFMASFGAHRYLINHDTNDFAMVPTPWSAADFGAAYGDLLDRLKIADPQAQVLCMTGITFSAEGPNSLGDTLPEYRAEIAAAAAARPGWCTLLEGPPLLDAWDDYDTDHIHPTPAGLARLTEAIRAALGAPWANPTPVVATADAEWQCNDGDVSMLIDHSGHSHHGQFGTDPQVDAADPKWYASGLIDYPGNDLILLPPRYNTAIGTGALTLWAVARVGTVWFPELFGADPAAAHLHVYSYQDVRKWQASVNPAIAGDPVAVGALEWHFIMAVYEPSVRVTLWTTSGGSLNKAAEDLTSVPASAAAATRHYIGNDVRLDHPINKLACAGMRVAAVADVDVPGIYEAVKAEVAARPTPIILP